MRLLFFSEKAYNDLFDHIVSNKEKYKSNENWVHQYFEDEQYLSESNIEYPDFELIHTGDITNDDYVNTVKIYNSIGTILSPYQACNKYMWAYLSHDKCWEYTRNRWPVEKGAAIETRYFCSGSRRSLTLNSISRLWWYGHLTYDETNALDPFERTKLLLKHTDLCQNLIQHEYSMNKQICLGILDGYNEYLLNGGEYNVDQERSLIKYINRSGAVSSLDFFSRAEISNMTCKYLMK